LDTLPNFVQLIKLAQAECGVGNPRVRPPRLELHGQELREMQKLIDDALRRRPQAVASYAMSMAK
jgi:4-hydroxy-tetrahydrodipicolinate synthase